MIEDNLTPLELSIIISNKNNAPCIEVRRCINDIQLIKTILTSAFHNRPLIVQPTFRNKYTAIANLIDKGIIYRENDEFYFTI